MLLCYIMLPVTEVVIENQDYCFGELEGLKNRGREVEEPSRVQIPLLDRGVGKVRWGVHPLPTFRQFEHCYLGVKKRGLNSIAIGRGLQEKGEGSTPPSLLHSSTATEAYKEAP